MFEYNAKPVLAGRITGGAAGSELSLRYRAPVWAYGFYCIWYSALALIAGGIVVADVAVADKAFMIGVTFALLAAPVALHVAGTRCSAEDLRTILKFLAEQTGAVPASGS